MEEKILNIVNTVLENRGRKTMDLVSTKTSLRDDIGLDSLDLAELTVRIEAEFGVDIFEDGIVNTIGDILKKLR